MINVDKVHGTQPLPMRDMAWYVLLLLAGFFILAAAGLPYRDLWRCATQDPEYFWEEYEVPKFRIVGLASMFIMIQLLILASILAMVFLDVHKGPLLVGTGILLVGYLRVAWSRIM